MKKLFFVGALALALVATSCSGTGAGANKDGFDTLFSKAKGDSLLVSLGTLAGSSVRDELDKAMVANPNLSKTEFLKGLQYAYSADTTTSFLYGISTGMQLLNSVKRYQERGLDVQKKDLLIAFKKAFLADSADAIAPMAAQMDYQQLDNEFREAVRVYEIAKLEKAPESVENIEKGIQYIDSLRQAESDVVVTASGVAYKIADKGTEPQVKPASRLRMLYTAKTLDGRIFDQMTEQNLRPTSVSDKVAGLKEVLPLLGQGGKATVVVPGKLAYGVEKNRRYNLGLNEPVIFDVEIVEVYE